MLSSNKTIGMACDIELIKSYYCKNGAHWVHIEKLLASLEELIG